METPFFAPISAHFQSVCYNHYHPTNTRKHVKFKKPPASQRLHIGQKASVEHTFTEEHVQQFANIVGDVNPVHFDEQFVKKQGVFKGKLVHGLLVGGLISTVAGTKLPGPGSIYLSQTFKFLKPAYIGDTLVAEVTLKSAKKRHVFCFETIVRNAKTGEMLISGDALVLHKEMILSEEETGNVRATGQADGQVDNVTQEEQAKQ